jgi:D-methionine transport system ATP-binding protein
MSVIRAIADRVVVLENARVIETGPVWRVFAAPEAAGTRRLLGSLRPELPEALAARLQIEPAGSIVLRLDVHGAQANAPLLADLSAAFGATTLLHGGIDHVQGEPVGSVFVSLKNRGPSFAAELLAYLHDRVTATEVLGYLATDA